MAGLERPLVGLAAGAVTTLVIQSSSATLGIAITLASQGLLSLPAGVAVMLGAEIGTCADTLVATLGRSREALRAGCSTSRSTWRRRRPGSRWSGRSRGSPRAGRRRGAPDRERARGVQRRGRAGGARGARARGAPARAPAAGAACPADVGTGADREDGDNGVAGPATEPRAPEPAVPVGATPG
jgi:hypothetical protein